MAKLNYIGRSDYLFKYSCNSSAEELQAWLDDQSVLQLDTETNVVDSIIARKLMVVQLADEEGENIFVVQWSFLTEDQKLGILQSLNDKTKLKICHNVSFEYQVMIKEGIVMDNVWDTMIMEQTLYAGNDEDMRYYSLANVLFRRVRVDISKEEQTQFGDDIITDSKLEYAATDVLYLGHVRKQQIAEMKEEDLIQLGNGEFNENEASLVFADIEYVGMGFDKERWLANIEKAKPIINKATHELEAILLQEPYHSECRALIINAKLVNAEGKERFVKLPAVVDKDTFTINWGSSPQSQVVLNYVYGDIDKCSVLELKKYLQSNDPNAPKLNDKGKPIGVTSKQFTDYVESMVTDKFLFLKLYINKKFELLERGLLSNFRDKLIEDKYLIPKNTLTVNWNSDDAKLEIFRWFNPKIEDARAETVEDNIHMPFFQSYKSYNEAHSLISKYGLKFIEKNVDSDGRVRTRFNTVLSTGRVSSSGPNMQQIPANALPKDRTNDYRHCFNPGIPGWVVVSGDYASQELAVIATLSQDPVFLDALLTEKDLHSVCAELVYGQKWKDSTEEGCAFYALNSNGDPQKKKCKCFAHYKLRDDVKAINFGLAYGMSAKGLSGKLKITLIEAESLIKAYFLSFPSIQGTLNAFGNYGLMNGFIRTPAPMRRKRYFPYWKGEETPKGLAGKISRASMNAPVQGFSADMIKIALILMRRYINNNNLRDVVKLFMQVHDQIDAITTKDVSERWSVIHKQIMEQAAEICLKNTLLKSEVKISDKWEK